MASINYLPAHKLKRLIKELSQCAEALHHQLDQTKRQCELIEQVMREIRRQTALRTPVEAPLVQLTSQHPPGRPELRLVTGTAEFVSKENAAKADDSASKAPLRALPKSVKTPDSP